MKKVKKGMTAEEVEALQLVVKLHEKSVRHTNNMTNSIIDSLTKENNRLTEENEYLKDQLYPLLEGLSLIQSVIERRRFLE